MSKRPTHFDDDPFYAEPYSTTDLAKPGFDPFEAHKAWCATRKATLATHQSFAGFAIARVKAAIAAVAAGKRDPTIPKQKHRKLKTEPTASERTVQEWSAAVKDIKKRKKRR